MDIKEVEILQRCYKKITDETFEEDDIFLLMIFIREYVQKNTWLKEFGDLIAHRVRDRGKVFNNLKSVYNSYLMNPFEEWSYEQKMAKTVLFDFSSIYFDKFFSEINLCFSNLGFDEITISIAEDILLCVFSLLQFSECKDKDNGIIYGTLNVFLLKDEVSINSYIESSIPLVCMGKINNRYMHLSDEETNNYFEHCNNKPIRIVRNNNKELLIKYDD